MKNKKLTLEEIEQWVNNDETLYTWRLHSRLRMPVFIKLNREALEQLIINIRDKQPGGNYAKN